MSDEAHTHGPTGPNETWQEGDHYHNGFGCHVVTPAEALEWNRITAERRSQMITADMTRGAFNPTTPCIKCGCTFPAAVLYCTEDDGCQIEHGKNEHLDRVCQRCGFIWAENVV